MPVFSRIRTTNDEIDAAIAAGKLEHGHRAIAASYDRASDRIVIELSDGIGVTLPSKRLQGLESATPEQIAAIKIEGPGTGLFWPVLDVAHNVPSLLEGVFGTRRWMTENGRKGGSKKSSRKAAAARSNGAKGGRPPKSAASSGQSGKPT